MKLPPEWKEFYLRSLQIPVLGRSVLGPLLRGLWKTIRFLHREPRRPPPPDGLLSTYASTIDGLRRQLEILEQRTAAAERELAQSREAARVQSLVLSAAVQSLLRRVEAQGSQQDFHRRALAAAVTGLQRRADALEPLQDELPATRCS